MRTRLYLPVAFLWGMALAPVTAQAPGMLEVAIDVELDCPSCAQGLERRLGRIDQVALVAVRAGDGRIVVTSEPGAGVDLTAIRDAVRNAGFIPDEIRVTAVGTVGGAPQAPALELPDGEVLRLDPADVGLPSPGHTARLVGVVQFGARGEPPLVLVQSADAP